MSFLGLSDCNISSTTAQYRLPEASFGLHPFIVFSLFSPLVQPKVLKNWVWFSEAISPRDLHRQNIVDEISPLAQFENTIYKKVQKFSKIHPQVVVKYREQTECYCDFAENLSLAITKLKDNLEDNVLMQKIRTYLDDISLFNDEYRS